MKLTHPREHAPPSPVDVARLAGLGDLRIGKHFLRGENKEPVGCVWVRSLWIAEVVTGFHPPASLAVISARGEKFNDCASPDWTKCVLATHQEGAVILLDKDPLPAALESVRLLVEEEHACLEGVAYSFTCETPQLRATLQFGNPTEPGLCSLEAGMLALARKVVHQADSAALRQVVEAWQEFVTGKAARA